MFCRRYYKWVFTRTCCVWAKWHWYFSVCQLKSPLKKVSLSAANSVVWECGPIARYVKLRTAHVPRMFSPPPRLSNPGMHHGTCVMHTSWCMPGSLTSGSFWSRWRAKRPGISGACTTRNFAYLARGPLTKAITISVLWSMRPTYSPVC